MSRGPSRPPAGRGSILDLDPYDDAFWRPDPTVVPLDRKRSPGAGRGKGRAKDAAPAAPARTRARTQPAPARRASPSRPPAGTRAAPRPAARRPAPPRRRPPSRPAGSVWKAGKPRRRLVTLAVVATLLFAVVLGRVAMLQTVDRPGLQEAGADQRRNVVALPADRGVVFDRNGTELALSVPKKTIWGDPMVVAKEPGRPAQAAAALAGVLSLTPEQVAKVQDQLGDPTSRFAYLSRFVTDEVAAAVEKLELPGIYVMNESERVYPAGEVGRAVIGSTDAFGVGIAGLEKQYDTLLTGDPGEIVYEQDQGGNTIPTGRREMKPPLPGQDIVLTIDKDLQYQVEQLLLKQVEATNARGGMVVVLDSASGEVLAMANVRRTDGGSVQVTDANLAVIDSYEPGSVAKLITASAALQEGVIDTERHMEVPGAIRMYDFDFTDAWPHGNEWWGIRDIVRLSSNIGTIFLAKDLGAQRMEQYLHGFGIGVPSGLDFPGETAGILKPVDEWQGSEKVTVSYGQGVGTTSLQLAAAVNVIANGGRYVAPSLVKATVDGSGKLVPAAPAEQREVISPQTSATMTEILRSVVCAGTAKEAKVPGYAVAGKTGTAYKAQGNGYEGTTGRKYVASFAGFVPAEAPRLSINVSIDEPIGNHYGGQVAAPLFAQVAQEALRLMEVPPSPDGGVCPGNAAPAP